MPTIFTSKERISIPDIMDKIKQAATSYDSFKHFVNSLFQRYDTDKDGYLNFQELSAGLSNDRIKLTESEKLALMKHLDADCDGVVTRDELYNALVLDARYMKSNHG